MEVVVKKKNFWKNKKVLITGHTGFKGSWLTQILINFKAQIFGYSLKPTPEQKLYKILKLKDYLNGEVYGNILDYNKLNNFIIKVKPQIIIHLAAQPLVSVSLKYPINTIYTNTIGTANLLYSANNLNKKLVILNVTSDKCYDTNFKKIYNESSPLGGDDPYSASKACSELVSSSFRSSVLKKNIIHITARSGNVIGGGDFSKNRLIPEIAYSSNFKKNLYVRQPKSTRPWLHVLETLSGYLKYIENAERLSKSGFYSLNFSPSKSQMKKVSEIIKFCIKKKYIKKKMINFSNKKFKEVKDLKISNKVATIKIKWKPKLKTFEAVNWAMIWYSVNFKNKKKIIDFTNNQIKKYFA